MENTKQVNTAKLSVVTSMILMFLMLVTTPVYAWLNSTKTLASYIPISTASSLFIGAGHNDDIKYLYFDNIDTESGASYKDYIFTITGEFAGGYKIQLAFTTNNQFTYDVFHATESTTPSASAIAYVAQNGTNYYYSINGAALVGTYMNQDGADILADSSMHSDTYGSYSNVDKYAEPLYWQTTSSITGDVHGSFTHYYILRVYFNSKGINDKETDVLCIAARTASSNE